MYPCFAKRHIHQTLADTRIVCFLWPSTIWKNVQGRKESLPRKDAGLGAGAHRVDFFVACRYIHVQFTVHVHDPIMNSISYTLARSNLAKTMDRVCDDHVPVAITRKGQGAVVMMSMDDYQALEETAYLLRSPKNVRRLLEAILGLESGKGKERALAE